MQPTIGEFVDYTLGEGDVQLIDQNVPLTGRNHVSAGEVYPAMVVRVFHPTTTTANLKVFLDGGPGAEYWATSRTEGDGPCHWVRPQPEAPAAAEAAWQGPTAAEEA